MRLAWNHHFVFDIGTFRRVPMPPGKSWIVFLKIPGPGSPEKSLWSWKVLETDWHGIITSSFENYVSLKSPASLALNVVSRFSAK